MKNLHLPLNLILLLKLKIFFCYVRQKLKKYVDNCSIIKKKKGNEMKIKILMKYPIFIKKEKFSVLK